MPRDADPAFEPVPDRRSLRSKVLGFAKSAGPELYRTVVTRFPGFNWVVMVQQPTSVALAPIQGVSTVQDSLKSSKQQMIIILVIVIILVFMLAIFIAGMLSKMITRPLLDLREQYPFDLSLMMIEFQQFHLQQLKLYQFFSFL